MDCPLYIYRMGRNELRIGEKRRQNVRGAGFLASNEKRLFLPPIDGQPGAFYKSGPFK